jgi:hypothetical protein
VARTSRGLDHLGTTKWAEEPRRGGILSGGARWRGRSVSMQLTQYDDTGQTDLEVICTVQ